MAPAGHGVVWYVCPADGRSEWERACWEVSELLCLSVAVILSGAFFRLFLDDDRDEVALAGCVSAFGPDWFQMVLSVFIEDQEGVGGVWSFSPGHVPRFCREGLGICGCGPDVWCLLEDRGEGERCGQGFLLDMEVVS